MRQPFPMRSGCARRRWASNAGWSAVPATAMDGDQTLLADVPVYTPPVPAVAEIAADPARFEVVEAHRRWAFDRNEIRVFFPVADTELYPDKFGNQATLDKIVEGIRKIGSTEKLRLSGVEITGFASPEGALALNTRLGGERARALKTYIAKAVPELCDADFQLINGVENWDDLLPYGRCFGYGMP